MGLYCFVFVKIIAVLMCDCMQLHTCVCIYIYIYIQAASQLLVYVYTYYISHLPKLGLNFVDACARSRDCFICGYMDVANQLRMCLTYYLIANAGWCVANMYIQLVIAGYIPTVPVFPFITIITSQLLNKLNFIL